MHTLTRNMISGLDEGASPQNLWVMSLAPTAAIWYLTYGRRYVSDVTFVTYNKHY